MIEYQTMTWLDCETAIDGGAKSSDKARVCTKYKERIDGRKTSTTSGSRVELTLSELRTWLIMASLTNTCTQ